MAKQRPNIPFTADMLKEYESAAIRNAEQLHLEAVLLQKNGHHARGYFLAVASIEETGKAALAFKGRGRNLDAPNVIRKLNLDFQDHQSKISGAFIAMFENLTKEQVRADLHIYTDLIAALSNGREPSMYTDVYATLGIMEPSAMIKPKAAQDCCSLAGDCNRATRKMLEGNLPTKFSTAQDKWYSLGKKANDVWKHEDFGEFLLDIVERQGLDDDTVPKAVTTYHDNFLSKGKRFSKQ